MALPRLLLVCCGIILISVNSYGFNMKRHARIKRQSGTTLPTHLTTENHREISSSMHPPTEGHREITTSAHPPTEHHIEITSIHPSTEHNPSEGPSTKFTKEVSAVPTTQNTTTDEYDQKIIVDIIEIYPDYQPDYHSEYNYPPDHDYPPGSYYSDE